MSWKGSFRQSPNPYLVQEFRLKQAQCIQLDGYLALAYVNPMKGRLPLLWAKGSTVKLPALSGCFF